MNVGHSIPPVALTIAGSDSGGGAGIQADMKTFAALGVYGCSVLTAITAQNSQGVRCAEEVSARMVAEQMDAVLEDIPVAAFKTGMVSSVELIETIAAKIEHYGMKNYVLDPVMVAKSGDPLLLPEAREAVKQLLFPLARVATPNGFEAEALSGVAVRNLEEAKRAAQRLLELGAEAVVVKGGNFEPEAADVLALRSGELRVLRTERINTPNLHGTGCTFSAAITAFLAQGVDVGDAVHQAKAFVTEALRHSYPVGRGRGPVNHFWAVSLGSHEES